MIPLALIPSLLAGSVYINGVRADLLPEITISNATVRFDAQGNVWVDAPGYRVQVLPPQEMSNATPLPAGDDAAVSYRVPTGLWWMVTEDNASSGHLLEVLVNGTLVRRVTSGDPQVIVDLAPYLRPGANVVIVNPLPGPTPGGGPMNVYIGRGANRSGTIHLDNPDVSFSRRASDGGNGGGARQYTLTVP